MPTSIITVLASFLPLFSAPSYQSLLLLFQAHILCKGKRTVTELLKRVDLKDIKNYSKYHYFFSTAKWSAIRGAEILFLKLVALVPGGIVVSIDTTVERRKGPKIKGLGIQRDAVRSSKSRKVLVPGLNWLVCAIHIQLPWCKRTWALPFFTLLMPPEHPLKTSKNVKDLSKTKRHKTLTKWTCQVAFLLRRWVGGSKKITIVADSAFATYALANTCIDLNIGLVSRMRLDARTFEFPPEPKKRGRKKLVGTRIPSFKQMLEDPDQAWETLEVDWYNGLRKQVEILSGACLWYGYGIRPVPINWVLVRDPTGRNPPAVIFTTDLEMQYSDMIEVFVDRWQIETTFEEARRHLGMESQRQWSDNAIDRITPCILASYSIINLVALEAINQKNENIPIQTTSWYKKEHVTFSDVLAYLRNGLMREKYFLRFDRKPELWLKDIENLIYYLSAA